MVRDFISISLIDLHHSFGKGSQSDIAFDLIFVGHCVLHFNGYVILPYILSSFRRDASHLG